MINVKKKERKKSVWIGEIFLPDLCRFCGQKRLSRVWTFFFFFGQQQEQGKNDSFLEGALLSRRSDYMKTMRTKFYTYSRQQEKREQKRSQTKKKKKKKKKNDHICVHSYMTVSLRS